MQFTKAEILLSDAAKALCKIKKTSKHYLKHDDAINKAFNKAVNDVQKVTIELYKTKKVKLQLPKYDDKPQTNLSGYVSFRKESSKGEKVTIMLSEFLIALDKVKQVKDADKIVDNYSLKLHAKSSEMKKKLTTAVKSLDKIKVYLEAEVENLFS